MTTESTRPTPTGSFADLGPAIETLTYLQVTYPTLPTAHITVLSTGRVADLQASTPDAFEQWRTALQIPAADVDLHAYGGGVWLVTRTSVRGVSVVLTGHGLPLTVDEARARQVPDSLGPVRPLALAATVGDSA